MSYTQASSYYMVYFLVEHGVRAALLSVTCYFSFFTARKAVGLNDQNGPDFHSVLARNGKRNGRTSKRVVFRAVLRAKITFLSQSRAYLDHFWPKSEKFRQE